jgi:TonB-linked SusC/RagA family outer membrane protein
MLFIQKKIKQRYMRNSGAVLSRAKNYAFFVLLLIAAHTAIAQSRTITGTVRSEKTGELLAGVTLTLKKSGKGFATNAEGYYSITTEEPYPILVFSMVGYESKEISVEGRSAINVALQSVTKSMEEVVVVGYGTVKKSDLTGSVVSLKAGDLTPGANYNVQQSLQGRAAGVQVYQKSGEPGSAMSIKIRGASSITAGNDPLYVIDGMPVNDVPPVGAGSGIAGTPGNSNPRNILNSLNPSDIQSIEILKDASATAIYGSRGANGVVLITTKKGNTGRLKINYDASYGVQNGLKLKMLTGEQYRDVLNAIIDAGGGNPSERITGPVANTDWQQELMQQGKIQSHDLSLSGGANNTKYYVSLGYFDQEGIMKHSGTRRYSARVNLDNSVVSKYAFGVNLSTSYIKDQFNSNGVGLNDNASSLYMAINYDPTYSVYDSNGNFNRSALMFPMDHPVAVNEGQVGNSDTYRTFGNIYGEYFFIPSLSIKGKIGGDINNSRRNFWVDPISLLGQQNNGIASIAAGSTNYYMGEATLNYNTKFKNQAVNAVLGATYEHFGSDFFNGNGRGYILPDLTYNAIGSGTSTLNQIGSGGAQSKIASYLGRVNYSLFDKYLLTVSMRADGSSKFGPNNRFGYFPSAAFAWKVHEEKFLKSLSFLNELKFRASYGAIGNQSIANFLYIPTFSGSANAIFGGTKFSTIAPTRSENPDLKWEAAKQADVGIDFTLFASRLRGSIEYYQRKTTDLLLGVPQPPSSGFGTRTENIGSMKNSGFDITLSGSVIRTDDFEWNIDANLSTLKNEVVSLGASPYIITGGAASVSNASIIKPGESLGSYYGYEVLGVWQEKDDFSTTSSGVKPGDLKYKDQNGDKQITDADRVVLGEALPDFFYGLTTNWRYKRVDLSVFIEGSQGASVLNNNMVDSYFPISFRRNKLAEPYLNRWTPDNPTNAYPSFVNPTSQGQRQVNSRTVEDASYVRLQSVRLSYNLPVKNKVIKSASVFVNGQNLFTITKYSGVDPAINAIGDDILKIDYSTYPTARTYTGGVNIQF